jgi:hypothetical protein
MAKVRVRSPEAICLSLQHGQSLEGVEGGEAENGGCNSVTSCSSASAANMPSLSRPGRPKSIEVEGLFAQDEPVRLLFLDSSSAIACIRQYRNENGLLRLALLEAYVVTTRGEAPWLRDKFEGHVLSYKCP